MKTMQFKSFEDVFAGLDLLEQQKFELEGQWQAYQHLGHCAQAIAYSISGYPQLRPAFMRNTVGPVVFHIFALRGGMSHDTNALTPGAPPPEKVELTESIALMRENMTALLDWEGALQPHEFYGKLTKKEYLLAHSMHFADHFKSFRLQ